ncbi:MAG: response regulator [Bdellovibrionota bacterium]|nr:response regulator [Bdellovibrionota bacterium]
MGDNVENIKKNARSGHARVLIIDDSDLSRRTVAGILEREGFNVVGQAANAEQGMQQAYSTGANVFLIDVVMPDISGIEVANYIRENIKEPRIIMMSSLDIESVIIESISSGAIDFLSKPFEERDLIRAVEKIDIELQKEHG